MKFKNDKTKKIVLITASSLLAVILIAFIVLFVITPQESEAAVKNQKALNGITVNGIDISGMTKEEALVATSEVSDEVLNNIEISIDVEAEIMKYSAKDLGFTTDYDDVITKAINYGHTGSIFTRWIETQNTKKGVSFTVKASAEKEDISAALMADQDKFNRDPQDASAVFAPWGYLSDGTLYQQDQQAMIKAASSGKTWERPELVTIAEDQMPNKFRYEFWKNTDYVDDYIPADANIARFLYKDAVKGISVDMETVINSVFDAVQKDDFSVIKVPVEVTEPTVTLEDVKKNTQLISSWTSSYSTHNTSSRTWNVAKLSGIINGQIIEPSIEWSINKTAGNRTLAGGWMNAAGIENGGYTDQPGGGVCQISSTLYNAAIRSNLNITDSTHHSIISGYIPLGLDATISSGAPDLKIKNNQSTPIYIVSYINPKDKNVTVEIYGQTVVDSQYGDVILTYTSEDLGSYGGDPVMNYVYNATVSYDGTPIDAGKSVVYAEARPGRKAQTYKHILSLDGTELKVDKFTYYQWRPINGTTYVNDVDPSLTPAEPSPSPSPSVTP